jgi:hypothetical protein
MNMSKTWIDGVSDLQPPPIRNVPEGHEAQGWLNPAAVTTVPDGLLSTTVTARLAKTAPLAMLDFPTQPLQLRLEAVAAVVALTAVAAFCTEAPPTPLITFCKAVKLLLRSLEDIGDLFANVFKPETPAARTAAPTPSRTTPGITMKATALFSQSGVLNSTV